jgi:hypothetical protein
VILPDPAAPATLLGLGGVALNCVWPLLQGRRAMLAVQALSGSCFVAHYALLGAPTGSLMNALAVLQAVVAIPLGARPGFRRLYLLTLPLVALGLALSWRGWPSLCAALAMATTSVGRYQTRVLPFRWILLASIPFWVAHNLLVGSLPGLLSDLLVSTASGVGLWRTCRSPETKPALERAG